MDATQQVQEFVEEIKKLDADETASADDERIWALLDRIESWKKSNSSFSVAEVETALLPLVIKAEMRKTKRGAPPTTAPEDVSEIAGFTDSLELRVNEENVVRLLGMSQKWRISNVVSVLGDTHSGKSTLINELLHGAEGPSVAAAQQGEPTTANVHVFDARVEPPTSSAPSSSAPPSPASDGDMTSAIRFLDMEGENGGRPPKGLLREKLASILSTMKITEYQERRRNAVAANISRLSYVVSDVVLFVGNESFSNALYAQRLIRLVRSSVENVDSASSPSLVLVYNKCGLDEQFDIERCTEQFFENPENGELKHLFSEVKCVCIPHRDQVKKVRREGASAYFIDGEEIFTRQMKLLEAHIKLVLERRVAQRESAGLLFSEFTWCLLFQAVIQKFDERLRMGEILANILKPQDFLAARAFEFFLSVYGLETKAKTKDHFLRCRTAAVGMLGCAVVHSLNEKKQKFDRYVALDGIRSESVLREVERAFDELIGHISRLSPCEASFPGMITQNPRIVRCSKEQAMHGVYHRCSENVVTPPGESSGLFQRFAESLKFMFGVGYRATWPGDHSFALPRDEREEKAAFFRVLQLLSQINPTQLFVRQVAIMQTAVNPASRPRVSNISERCWICQGDTPSRAIRPCGHLFCDTCFAHLVSLPDGCAPVTLEDSHDEILETATISSKRCPLCLTEVRNIEVSTRVIPAEKRQLAQRYLTQFAEAQKQPQIHRRAPAPVSADAVPQPTTELPDFATLTEKFEQLKVSHQL